MRDTRLLLSLTDLPFVLIDQIVYIQIFLGIHMPPPLCLPNSVCRSGGKDAIIQVRKILPCSLWRYSCVKRASTISHSIHTTQPSTAVITSSTVPSLA